MSSRVLMAERDSCAPGPLVLNANASENYRKFLIQFEIYLVAKAKDEKPDKLKVKMLPHCAGSEAIEEYSHFVFNKKRAISATQIFERILRKCVKGLRMLSLRDYFLISETRKRESEYIIL